MTCKHVNQCLWARASSACPSLSPHLVCCFQGRRRFTPVPAQQRQPNRWQWAAWAAGQARVACGTCCRTCAPRTAHTAREALKPTQTYTHTVSTWCGGAVPSPRAGSAPAHTQSHTSSHRQAICHERGVCEWSVDQAGRWPRDAAAAGRQPALPPVRAGAGGAHTAGTSSGTGYCALPAPAEGFGAAIIIVIIIIIISNRSVWRARDGCWGIPREGLQQQRQPPYWRPP